jgi:exodeoxyribonuclease VII large subunit
MTLSNHNQQVPVLTVSQLTHAIKLSLESTFPFVCLQGEISNFKLQTSGHLYFSLKDANAQIAVVMFRADANQLKIAPKSGDHVIVKGEINVYPSKGNYQLIIRELSYIGLGELLQKLEQLKIKLHQKGWFKTARKKPLPKFPKRIGVVTSPTGAVIQDILNILTRRFSGFHLILNPVKVQGEGSAQEIARAIEQFNQHQLVDVMIIGRGGGSIEDLWAFNEEIVAEAIYNSQIPIICAVGHETDHCIADYVADVRAPTPSAAAEIVISEKNQFLQHLNTLKKRMQQTVMHLIHKDRFRLEGLVKQPFILRPLHLLEGRMQKLDDCRLELDQTIRQQLQLKKQMIDSSSRQTLALKPTNQLNYFRQKLQYWEKNLSQFINGRLLKDRHYSNQKKQLLQQLWLSKLHHRRRLFDNDKFYKRLDQLFNYQLALHKERLANLHNTLKAIDPKTLLNKGYSILFSEKEHYVINSIHKLKKQQKARILLSDGEALITVNETIPREQ